MCNYKLLKSPHAFTLLYFQRLVFGEAGKEWGLVQRPAVDQDSKSG